MKKLKEKLKKPKDKLVLTIKLSRRSVALNYKANPKITIILFVTTFFFSAFGLISNFLNAKIIDSIVGIIGGYNSLSNFIAIFIVFLVFTFISSTESSIRLFLDQYNFFCISKYVELALVDKLSKLDIQYFENPKTLDLINNVRENKEKVMRFIKIVVSYFAYFLQLIFSLAVIMKLSAVLVLIIAAVSVPRLINRLTLGKRSYGIWDENSEVRRDFNDTSKYLTSEETLPEIRLFNILDFLKARVERTYSAFISKQVQLEKTRFKSGLFIDFISVLGFAACLYIISKATIAGEISIGLFTFYTSTMYLFSRTLDDIIKSSASLFEYSLFIGDFFKVMELPVILNNGSIHIKSNNPPFIEFKNVSFKYPNNNNYIFKHFDFKIEPGDKIAIVGENGAGKSTLIKLIQRHYDVDEGQILINGINIKDIDNDSLYKNFSVLSQRFNRYHFDAKTNIGVGNLSLLDDMESIRAAAIAVGADEFISNYENKYNQILSKHFPSGVEPSFGQWQKIALARAIIKNSPVIILDEPTSSIDPKSEASIFNMLFDYAKDKTILIISHRFSTVRKASRIIVLSDGKIVEEGTHPELLELNGIYKETYEIQKKGYVD